MKNYKKILAFVLSLTMLAAFAGCGSGDSGKKTIGIIQFGSHGSLNNCYDGVMKGLEENGITEEEYNEFYKDKFFDFEDPLCHIHAKNEGAATYNALMYIPARVPFDFYTKE